MPTTVYIPDPLLKAVDRRAKALGISRNRLVIRALHHVVESDAGWSADFLKQLRDVDRTQHAVDDLIDGVTRRRRSKTPLHL
jgi:hypothetical protein